MNRILLTLLCISIAVLPVRGQDPDTIAPVTDTIAPATGTIAPQSDTIAPQSDTIALQSDTIPPVTGTIAPQSDTIPPVTESSRPEFKPVYREADTVRREFDTIPRVMEPGMLTADTVEAGEPDFSHSPSKAMMYALVLPGLGQAYNKKYFKIPIVYVGLGAAVYAINYNSTNYRIASQEYAQDQNDLNERYLRTWRRWMEISYIALAAVYALQVLDAYVDAHLYSWDVNQNLSLRIAPSLQPVMVPGSVPVHQLGLVCRFELKGR